MEVGTFLKVDRAPSPIPILKKQQDQGRGPGGLSFSRKQQWPRTSEREISGSLIRWCLTFPGVFAQSGASLAVNWRESNFEGNLVSAWNPTSLPTRAASMARPAQCCLQNFTAPPKFRWRKPALSKKKKKCTCPSPILSFTQFPKSVWSIYCSFLSSSILPPLGVIFLIHPNLWEACQHYVPAKGKGQKYPPGLDEWSW